MFLSLLYAFSAPTCERKPYDPGLKPLHYGICEQPSTRNMASIPKNKFQKPGKSLDPLRKYDPRQRKIYQALKSGKFHNVDFNEDGKSDVNIRQLGKGYKEIRYSFRGDGQFNQISVYNAQGKLVKERVDYDMDAQVDYLYECKDDVCEIRSDYVAGKANKLIRQITDGNTRQFEIFERKNGQMVLVEKGTQKVPTYQYATGEVEVFDHTEGAAAVLGCEHCDQDLIAFAKQLDDIKNIQSHMGPRPDLEEEGDFYISPIGTMIHKNCFEPGRWKFDIAQADVDSMVQGMSCLAEGEEYYGEKGEGKVTSTKYALMPAFVNYWDKEAWDTEVTPFYNFNEVGRFDVNSCDKLKKINFYRANAHNDCSVEKRFGARPKIFCGDDINHDFRIALEQNPLEKQRLTIGSEAYATLGSDDPVIINYKGKTRVYNGPSVVFREDLTKNWSKKYFESMLFHERIHNLGSVHQHETDGADGIVTHNDYAWACQAMCFQDQFISDMSVELLDIADQMCFNYEVDKAQYKKYVGAIASKITKKE